MLEGQFSTTPPVDRLVNHVHVVGFVASDIVLCRDNRDVWFLPGGTREPGETIEECADREIAEEAGARRVGPLQWLGAHHFMSLTPEPYRPHLAHPENAWLWCVADVVLDSAPTNPPDGEQVVEVRAAGLDEARDLIRTDGDWLPDLLDFAWEVRTGSLGTGTSG